MRKQFVLLVAMLMAGCCMMSLATSDDVKEIKEKIQKQKAIKQEQRRALDQKVSKDARNQAKEYVKQGWKVAPGKLSIEKQLDKAYLMQVETNDEGYEKYLMGSAQAIGQNLDAAKFQSMQLARLDIASQLETEIIGLVENAISNEQLAENDAASITRTVADSKNKIASKMGRVITCVEMYRELPNQNKEVSVTIFYDQNLAREAAKRVIKENMENKTEEMGKKIDEMLGW